MNHRFRVLLVGCGAMGQEHLKTLLCDDRIASIIVSDLDQIAAQLGASMGNKIIQGQVPFEKILSEFNPDVVHITTPAGSHAKLIRDSLRYGAHVVVEKPWVLDSKSAASLLELAKYRNLQIFESCNYLYENTYKKLKKLMIGFGAIHQIDIEWRLNWLAGDSRYADPYCQHPSHKLPLGVMHEFISHCLYAIQDLCSTVKLPACKQIQYQENAGPLLQVQYVHQEHVGCQIRIDGRGGPEGFWIRIYLDQAIVEVELFRGRLKLIRNSSSVGRFVFLKMETFNALAQVSQVLHFFGQRVLGLGRYTGLKKYINNIYDKLESGQVDARQYTRILAINLAVDHLVNSKEYSECIF